MSGVRVTDKDHGYRELVKRVYGFAQPRIEVGILGDDPTRAGKSRREVALSLLEVAIINEFGSEDGAHPPARSFLRAWFDLAKADIHEQLRRETVAVLKGQRTKEQALARVAQWCVGAIQARMAAGIDPPNADSTVLQKGSSKPLIDTGQLRSSVTYRIT